MPALLHLLDHLWTIDPDILPRAQSGRGGSWCPNFAIFLPQTARARAVQTKRVLLCAKTRFANGNSIQKQTCRPALTGYSVPSSDACKRLKVVLSFVTEKSPADCCEIPSNASPDASATRRQGPEVKSALRDPLPFRNGWILCQQHQESSMHELPSENNYKIELKWIE